MDLDQSITTLDDLRRNDPVIQRGRNGELTNSWNGLLNSIPDRVTFVKHTAGLLITPEMLYDWIECPIWMRKDAEPEKKEGATPARATEAPAAKGGKHAPRG